MSLDTAQDKKIGGLNLTLIWQVLLILQALSVWVLYPILIVYYESNENDGTVSVVISYCSIEEKDQESHASSYPHVHSTHSCNSTDILLAQRCKQRVIV
jgi:hypothetical protein